MSLDSFDHNPLLTELEPWPNWIIDGGGPADRSVQRPRRAWGNAKRPRAQKDREASQV